MKNKFTFYVICIFIIALLNNSCNSSKISDPKILIEKYLACSSWQDRLLYIEDSTEVKPIMEKYYEKAGFSVKAEYKNIKQLPRSNSASFPDSIMLMSVTAVGKNLSGAEVTEERFYYLVNTLNGLKIDWLSSVGYNKLKLNVYQATHPSTSTIFRMNCKISDYYNYGFRDMQNQYYSIECSTVDPENYSTIYGYVLKNSEEGIKLFEILKDGQSHKMTLALKYDYKSEGNSDIATIKKLITEGWYFNELATITNPEILSEYFSSDQNISTFQGYPDQSESSDKFVTEISTQFTDDSFIISTNNMMQGNVVAKIIEYCNLTDESLEVFKIVSNSILGESDRNVHKVLLKLPNEDKTATWNYNDSDGTKYTCSSKFITIDYKGEQIKAIKVSEKNSAFPSITTYRYYLKGIGLYKESQEDDKGIISTTLKLIVI